MTRHTLHMTGRLPAQYREYLLHELSLLLQAGVPVDDALQTLQETSRSTRTRTALRQVQSDLAAGMPLWKSFTKRQLFNPQTESLITLGEQSGNLVENLRIAAEQEHKQHVFRTKVLSALLYPAFVLGITVAVGVGVAWFLLPRLAETFTTLPVHLPLISRIVLHIGTFLHTRGAWLIPAAALLLAVAVYMGFIAPSTRALGQRLLLHTPGIAQLLHEVEVARFGYVLSILLDAGLPITQALRMLSQSATLSPYRSLYSDLADAFENGYSFRSSLSATNGTLLPASVRQMVIAGERSGALPDTLRTIGISYEQKADITTASLATILEPILLLIVWLAVLGVAVAVIIPIYSLVSTVGSA